MNRFYVLSCMVLVFVPASLAVLTLRPVSTIYLPYSYTGETPNYGIDEAAVEQTGYDVINKISYSAGNNFIHIIDWSDVNNPTILRKVPLATPCNDMEMCGSYVGFVQEGETPQDLGTLHIYTLYDKTAQNWTELYNIQVGYKPDMLHFSHDCLTILTANEGEAAQNSAGTEFVNPEGSVSIVRLSPDTNDYTIATLNFTKFNGRADEYVMRGVRYPYRGELDGGNDTFSQNIEPEYITYNADDSLAFIALQENNAIAVVDLLDESIREIYPLGEKSWGKLNLDASDRDGGIVFRHHNISSFYQPDGIKYFEENGVGYIITANEGDNFEYELGNDEWKEEQRGNDFSSNDFASTVGNDFILAVDDNDILGRLQFSRIDGFSTNEPGKYEKLYFYGGRSFSIFRADDLSLVYDSGDEVEQVIAQYLPDVFNTNTKPDDAATETPADLADTRSDNLGPECESVEIGEIDGRRVLFIGVDRTAVVLIYSFDVGEVIPTFESVYRAGGRNETFQNLLDNRNLGDLDPEDIKFIPASQSSTGMPMIMITSTVSGTVSLHEVYDDEVPIPTTDPTGGATSFYNATTSFMMILFCFNLIMQIF